MSCNIALTIKYWDFVKAESNAYFDCRNRKTSILPCREIPAYGEFHHVGPTTTRDYGPYNPFLCDNMSSLEPEDYYRGNAMSEPSFPQHEVSSRDPCFVISWYSISRSVHTKGIHQYIKNNGFVYNVLKLAVHWSDQQDAKYGDKWQIRSWKLVSVFHKKRNRDAFSSVEKGRKFEPSSLMRTFESVDVPSRR